MLRQVPLALILIGLVLSVSGCICVQPGNCEFVGSGSLGAGLACDQGCAVSECESGNCDGHIAGGPLAGFFGSGCCGLGGCGQWYVDEWINEPPEPDHCGFDHCGSDVCSRGCGAPARSFFRMLLGDRCMDDCVSCGCDEATTCAAGCDSGCASDGGYSSGTGCQCGGNGVGTTPGEVSNQPTEGYSTPVPSAPTTESTTKPTSKIKAPTPAPVLKSSAATRLNPAMRKVVR